MLYRLVIVEADREVSHALVPGETVVGAGADCGVRLGHPAVSRRHASLEVDGEGVWLDDLGSSNGTYTDGRRLTDRVRLVAPTELGFGPVAARLELLDPADAEAAVLVKSPGPGTRPRRTQPGAPVKTATTIQSASLQRLLTEALPSWIDGVERGLDPVALGQRIGASLFDSLPLRSLVLFSVRPGEVDGEIFRVGGRLETAPAAVEGSGVESSAAEAAGDHEVQAVGRSLGCRAHFPHAIQARAYLPVIENALRLADLVQPARPTPLEDVSDTADRGGSPGPDLPEPATVVPEVRSIYADAARIAAGDISVLITGESGTGKEVLARYLHRASPRRDRSFVAINCAALPRDLLEAELFGIEEGVATGVTQRAGCFERADGGTLFLDEIGDMGAETQARILRVLQEGEVFRLGAKARRSANVRVLAATNRDIDALLATHEFRSDLFHRISDWRVELPPLRRRRADILNLAAHFLAASCRKRDLAAVGISRRAAGLLEGYGWPGNIRQREREISRAVLFLEPGELLQGRHLQKTLHQAPAAGDGGSGRTLEERLEAAEKRILEDEIRAQGGNVRAAAEALAMGRSTLYRRIRELGLDIDRD